MGDLNQWLSLLGIPVLGWVIKKLHDSVSKNEVNEFMELKMAPLKEQIKALEDKIDSIDGQLVRLEAKVDKLPELLIKTMNSRLL